MNYLYTSGYNSKYYLINKVLELPRMTDVINSGVDYSGYNLFKFYNKIIDLFFSVYKEFLSPINPSKSSNHSVLWLVDSPRMTHLIINEIIEAEMMGYENVIILGRKNVGKDFFKVKDVRPMIEGIHHLIKKYSIKAIITPCLNRIHNSILEELQIKKIGIQHGYGTWVEKDLLAPVDVHFNFGEISHNEFNNPKSQIAGYSPTKLFSLYPQADENYILYLSQGRAFTNKSNIISDLGLLRLQDDFKIPIVIKEHVDATGEFAGTAEKIYSESQINTIELIRKSSLVITSWSGGGIESIFFNKPTIILDTQHDNGKFYKDSGLVIPMDYDKLKTRVDFFLSGKSIELEQFKNKINFDSGRSASKIIINSI